MPGATAGGDGGGSSAFAKPSVSFFQRGAPAAADAGGNASEQQPSDGVQLPALRTSSGADGGGEVGMDPQQADTGMDPQQAETNGALHWASSEALLNAEDGAASPPPVKQVCHQPLLKGKGPNSDRKQQS